MFREKKPEASGGPAGEEPSSRGATYPLSRLSAPIRLVDAAREIEKADAQLGTVVSAKLDVIVEQIRALQDEARAILDEARAAQELHRAECRFKKIPGRVYHLYRREDGRRYFSMLSPEEWAGKAPHAFEGSFRLEPDMTWTPAASLGDREERDARAREVLALLAGRGRNEK